MSDSRSSPPLLRMSTLRGPVVPVVDFPGAGLPSSLRSFAATPPPSQVPPVLMLAEDIKITIPDLLPEKSRPVAPRPNRPLPRGTLVRDLEVIVEAQNKQHEQEAALARLPGMLEDLAIWDMEQGQRSRKRGREAAEDAIQLEHQARKHYAVPPESVRTVAASTATSSRKLTKARQPSRAGRPGHGEPASQVPRAVARPPFKVEMLEDQDDDANDLLDARAQRYRRARTAPPRAEGERRL